MTHIQATGFYLVPVLTTTTTTVAPTTTTTAAPNPCANTLISVTNISVSRTSGTTATVSFIPQISGPGTINYQTSVLYRTNPYENITTYQSGATAGQQVTINISGLISEGLYTLSINVYSINPSCPVYGVMAEIPAPTTTTTTTLAPTTTTTTAAPTTTTTTAAPTTTTTTAAHGPYSDWYLPALFELEYMYENLYLNDVGGLKNTSYWSSNISGYLYAWVFIFIYGSECQWSKRLKFYVRAVRSFYSLVDYSIGDTGQAGGLIFYNDGDIHYESYLYDSSTSLDWFDAVTYCNGLVIYN